MDNERKRYLIEQFTKKFRAIGYEQWTTGEMQNERGQRCAMGHCLTPYLRPTKEAESLGLLFDEFSLDPLAVNDAPSPQFQHYHPRTRILAALEFMARTLVPPVVPVSIPVAAPANNEEN